MKEMNAAQLEAWMKLTAGTCYVYVYTPMCGTCKLAERMLTVIEAMRPQLPLVKINIRELVPQMERWRIESVPCLMRIQDAHVQDKLYAFRSVDYLYGEMKRSEEAK